MYFKNIKHLLSYVLDSEVERQFFLDTMKSLFSRYELAMILYYALAEIDPDFKGLVKKSGLLAGLGKSILLKEEHMDPFSCPS